MRSTFRTTPLNAGAGGLNLIAGAGLRKIAVSRCFLRFKKQSSAAPTVAALLDDSELHSSGGADKRLDGVDSHPIFVESSLLAAAATFMPLLLDVQAANAAGGEFGILEGKSAALIHPIAMISLFAFSVYTAWLGFQWRRTRTIPDEINNLKKQIPATSEGAPPSPVQAQIDKLTEERKVLLKGGYRDKHFNFGSILLGAGVLLSIEGGLNTYLRAGKLFPGPHLYAGTTITVLWALAASLVPAMQKGNDTARSLHIAFNTVNILMFVSQIPTGWEIVEKVWKFAAWP